MDSVQLYPDLHQVFGGYLNQDFDADFESPDAALRAAAREQGPEQIGGALAEIDRLLASSLSDHELDRILDRLTANGYSPLLDGWEIRPWLAHARSLLAEGT